MHAFGIRGSRLEISVPLELKISVHCISELGVESIVNFGLISCSPQNIINQQCECGSVLEPWSEKRICQ